MTTLRHRLVPSARRIFLSGASTSTVDNAVLERLFFKSICLPNGTHKTTSPNRLTDVDEILCNHLQSNAPIHLLDVGISSGVTTSELLDRIESQSHKVTGIGIDIRLRAYLRSWMGMDILYDEDGYVLQVSAASFVKGRPDRPLVTVRSNVLQIVLNQIERFLVRRWLRAPQYAIPITLVTPRIADRPGFRIVEQDIRKPFCECTGSYDVIRAANILNLSYFEPEILKNIVVRLTESLSNDGLLVVCRTGEDGTNHGTIFRKQEGLSALQPICRIGVGSEIEPLLLIEPDGRLPVRVTGGVRPAVTQSNGSPRN